MTLTAAKTDGLKYELMSVNKTKIVDGKGALIKEAKKLGTPTLIWLIVKRHRVGLLLVGNIILLLNLIIPQWFSILLALFGK